MTKNQKQFMKKVNTDGENLYIFWMICGISIKCSEKMWLMIILKVKKIKASTSF